MRPDIHPLSDGLGKLEYIEAVLGPAPDWLSARAVASGCQTDELRAAVLRQTGPTDERTIGVQLMTRFAETAEFAPMLYALTRRVPVLSLDSLRFQTYDGETFTRIALASGAFHCLAGDPDVNHPDARPVGSIDDLRRLLVEGLQQYHAPMVDCLQATYRLGRKVLWGRAAMGLASIVTITAEQDGMDAAVDDYRAVLGHAQELGLAPPTVEVLEESGQRRLAVWQGVCCLAYRWVPDNERCAGSCPLIPRAERVASAFAEA